jgi:hypothetical protein
MQLACNECFDKHQHAPAALYGKLEYILFFVNAGDDLAVFGMPVDGAARATLVVPRFSVREQGPQTTPRTYYFAGLHAFLLQFAACMLLLLLLLLLLQRKKCCAATTMYAKPSLMSHNMLPCCLQGSYWQ